ncbi:uncharacterized protein MONBRDRAFT_5991, partial [Monosiga brevicollis MX1]
MAIVVVTGGAGFLGGHLVKLLADGPRPDGFGDVAEVRVVDLVAPNLHRLGTDTAHAPRSQVGDTLTIASRTTLAGVQNQDRVTHRVGSVADATFVTEALTGATLVFHCAAIVDWGQRPREVLEEADPYHMPNILKAVLDGQLVLRMGSPAVRFQHTYVGNAAWAHLVAAKALLQNASVGGTTYIITDEPAVNF